MWGFFVFTLLLVFQLPDETQTRNESYQCKLMTDLATDFCPSNLKDNKDKWDSPWIKSLCKCVNGNCGFLVNFQSPNGQECVFLTKSTMMSISCLGAEQFMCQEENDIFRNKTYKLNVTWKDWTEAQNSCRAGRGDLASVHSNEERKLFNGVSNDGTLWIGLYYNVSTNLWTWSNGDSFTYCNNSTCCSLPQAVYPPHDGDVCSMNPPFVCFRDQNFTTTTTTVGITRSAAISGTSDFAPQTAGNLYFVEEKKTWVAALKHCMDHHSTLVHITNESMQTAVEQLMIKKTFPSGGVWIGLERSFLDCSGSWFWTGLSEVDFTKWDNEYNSTAAKYYCGKIIHKDNNKLRWQDGCCEDQLPFICQGASSG